MGEVCLSVSLRHEQDTPPRLCMFQSANSYNANGRKPEGQGTQRAHGHGLGPGQGLCPLEPALARTVTAGKAKKQKT